MTSWRTRMTLALMVVSLGFLTAADIECEDDEFELNWPSISHHDDGGYYYYEEYDCGYWCGF